MTDSTTPPPPGEPTADETFTWTEPSAEHGHGGPSGAAPSLIDSVRDVMDDLAERAGPSVREFSARAAELAAIAADRAAPLAKRAGEVTADASGKLATMSRSFAADLRASATAGHAASTTAGEAAPAATAEPEPVAPPSEPARSAADATIANQGTSDPT